MIIGVNVLNEYPILLSTKKIWDNRPHSAFTDLIIYRSSFYCVFREGVCHEGDEGAIRVLISHDGESWETASLIKREGVDLRDPKLSITPDGKLMLLIGAVVEKGRIVKRMSQVSFSDDGKTWTPLQTVLNGNEWLWRVTWHQGNAYGVSYRVEKERWPVTLFVSQDGVHYEKVKELDIEGRPSETTLRFSGDGEMIALVRRGRFPFGSSLIGCSQSPYQEWQYVDTKTSIGGPNFLILPTGEMWAAGRIDQFDEKDDLVEKTALMKMTTTSLTSVLDLPSGGEDTSYPGMVFRNGRLWISYYSSHEEGKASIYLSQIKLQP